MDKIIKDLLIDNHSIPFQKAELQNTKDWYSDRWGKITSSKLDVICAPKGFGIAAINYLSGLLYERYQVKPSDMHIELMNKQTFSWEIKLGKQYEPIAREELSSKIGYDIENVGFKHYPGFEGQAGDSSDGIFKYRDYIIPVELKCTTNSSTTMKRYHVVNEKHQDFWQCQGHILAYKAPFMIYGVYDIASNYDHINYQIVMPKKQDFLKERLLHAIELLKHATDNKLNSVDDENINYSSLRMFPF